MTTKAQLLCLTLATSLFFGCLSDAQIYIQDHSTETRTYGSEIAEITLHIEDPENFDDSTMSDLVWVHRHFVDEILPENTEIRHVELFIPKDEESFTHVCRAGWNGCIQTFEMVDGDIIVTINPRHWNEGRYEAVATFAHELTHFVSYILDGSGDGRHENPAYWGPDGIVAQTAHKWQRVFDVY